MRLWGVATWFAQPLLRAKLKRRARNEPGYTQAVEERFGRYDNDGDDGVYAPNVVGPIWIHAVSLGEARAAGILITALRRLDPDVRLVLTHGTATGRAEGAKWLRKGDVQVWQPWDTPAAVARFLDRFRPRIGVLMETEVWPELSFACAARGLPLVLANARLSARSLAGYERIRWFARPMFASLAAVYAQSAGDAVRLGAIGAKVEAIFGNLKFDAAVDTDQIAQGRGWRSELARPVVLFASSREGEERELLRILEKKRAEAPVDSAQTATNAIAKSDHDAIRFDAVQWLIVPRHPQRFDAVAALIESEGFTLSRRSMWNGAPARADIWLGDSLAEMALYFGLADVALLGGSFEPLGGQNLIEAAACGCPIVIGPSTFNFAEAAELAIDADAAIRVADLDTGVRGAMALLESEERRAEMADAALVFASAHRGAAERTARAVVALANSVAKRSSPIPRQKPPAL